MDESSSGLLVLVAVYIRHGLHTICETGAYHVSGRDCAAPFQVTTQSASERVSPLRLWMYTVSRDLPQQQLTQLCHVTLLMIFLPDTRPRLQG